MSFINQFQLANNTTFQQRIQVAMYRAAVNVIGEDDTDKTEAFITKRQQLALQVLAGQLTYNFCLGVVSNNTDINENSLDTDLEFMVNSLWNKFAGVNHNEM